MTTCPDHGTTLPCPGCSADHAAGEHQPGTHPATCARCAEIATVRTQIDAAMRAAGDDTLDEGETP